MISIRSLVLSAVDDLGPRARRCAYWQTDSRHDHLTPADPEFEKEAWISHVSLEWGVCGQLAHTPGGTIGAAFYSPPGMVPRASRFPTSPVGSDAILLAGMTAEADSPSGILTWLLDAVVVDLRRRGIKALEAFGLTSEGPADETSRDGCGAPSCVTGTAFLVEHGFTVVEHHEKYPRLRLEIESEHQWQADVERALDQLFAERGFPARKIGVLTGASARSGLSPAGVVRNR